tara:strand:+ start:57 stop:650 length:594 start_codon:yes stop_codon:yes gene_type:complete
MVDKRISGDTSSDTNMAKRYPIRNDGLTDKQRVFVKIYAENEGRLTPTECARQAGYAEDRANTTASELLNGKRFPKVVEAVLARRAEIQKTHEVKLDKHVQELARLREKSLAEKSYSAAVNAERLRGQAAGLYIDRKEIRTGSIDSMSREDVLKALQELGIDGQIKKEGNNTIISVEKSNSKGPKDITPVSSEDQKE